jgi:hypothetical protein
LGPALAVDQHADAPRSDQIHISRTLRARWRRQRALFEATRAADDTAVRLKLAGAATVTMVDFIEMLENEEKMLGGRLTDYKRAKKAKPERRRWTAFF